MGSLGASGAYTRHSLKIEMVSRRDPVSVFAVRPCLLAQGMGVQETSRTSGQTLPLAPASRERQKARSDSMTPQFVAREGVAHVVQGPEYR